MEALEIMLKDVYIVEHKKQRRLQYYMQESTRKYINLSLIGSLLKLNWRCECKVMMVELHGFTYNSRHSQFFSGPIPAVHLSQNSQEEEYVPKNICYSLLLQEGAK